jgi:glycosyltransferase involved in cell wall biosynthesis
LNILLVSPFLPYPGVPHAGGKLVYFLLRLLSRRHSVFLLSRVFPGEERNLPGLKALLSGMEVVPVAGPVDFESPFSVCRTAWSYCLLSRKAKELLRTHRFDVCQVEFTETGFFFTPPRQVPSILSCHDIIAKPAFRRYASAQGFPRIVAWGSWMAKRGLEKRAISRFRRVFTLSEEDQQWAKRMYPGAPFRVLYYPGGIDYTGLPRKEFPNRILFLGAMNRPANIEAVRYFLRQVWPSVRKEIPEAELMVAGGGITEAFKEELGLNPRVTFAGYVERIEEVYKSAAIFVAPILEGGGIIVKILDAMAAGVPVVTTSYGNEGIRAKAGEEILVADDPGEFARSVTWLLREAEYRRMIGEAGQLYVERRFSAELLSATIEETYKEAVDKS